jgi:hypothetical protein
VKIKYFLVFNDIWTYDFPQNRKTRRMLRYSSLFSLRNSVLSWIKFYFHVERHMLNVITFRSSQRCFHVWMFANDDWAIFSVLGLSKYWQVIHFETILSAHYAIRTDSHSTTDIALSLECTGTLSLVVGHLIHSTDT